MLKYIHQFSSSFSPLGLLIGLVFFCISLTPSLLPRNFVVQGILSGVVFTTGYIVAKFGHWLWKFMELRELSQKTSRKIYWPLLLTLTALTVFTLGRIIVWQNSIRLLMEMAPIETAYPVRLCGIAIVTALSIILLLRLLRLAAGFVVNVIDRYLPRRIAIVVGSITVTMLLLSFINGVIIKSALNAMDESFATLNKLMDSDYDQPQRPQQSGSKVSLISWSDIGRNGKKYVVDGPTKEEITEVTGKKSMQPIRVYAGFDTGETLEDRAQAALDELKRVGGFNRSTLIIATSTGTGWLDPSAVDTIEYIHSGNITTVSLQYSYLPSWLTLLVEPEAAIEASSTLFHAVYNYWTTLPTNKRPKLYLYGLSLGALGSADAIDLLTIISNPIDGALWSGPPFLSRRWNDLTRNRLPDSPQWRPVYGDSSVVRFATQDGFSAIDNLKWSSFRIVYLQHPSDPMSFFSSNLAYAKPDWLGANRGPDVSPYLRWFPIVSALQVAFDVPMATSVPLGYGHNFAPAAYIDAWIEVTQPEDWDEADTKRLKEHFVDFNPSPT
ncbi:alpha/beta hydrolase [Desulforhopalus sp. 52FAK]